MLQFAVCKSFSVLANFKSNENHVFCWVHDVWCGGVLAEEFRWVRDGWYGFGCGYGCGYGTGTVQVRYGYGTGTIHGYGRYGTWVRHMGTVFSYPCTVPTVPMYRTRTVPVPYPYPNPYQPSRTYHLAYRPASKMANRALLSKLANLCVNASLCTSFL